MTRRQKFLPFVKEVCTKSRRRKTLFLKKKNKDLYLTTFYDKKLVSILSNKDIGSMEVCNRWDKKVKDKKVKRRVPTDLPTIATYWNKGKVGMDLNNHVEADVILSHLFVFN